MSYTLTIDGVDRSGIMFEESLTWEDTLEGRSTCSFTLFDSDCSLSIPYGETVEFTFQGTLLFSGTIDEVSIKQPDWGGFRVIEVTCVDWNQTLDRFTVNATYDEKTLSYIVNDIVTNTDITQLAAEGLTIGDVDSGPTLTKVRFPYRAVSDCFNDLAELSGLTWNVKPDKTVNFFEKATYTAPFSIGDSSKQYRNASIGQARRRYRNCQILRAGKDKTDLRYEYFRGDYAPTGSTDPTRKARTFTLTYPVGEKPRIFVNSVEIPSARIGIKGVDKDGDITIADYKKWFYQIDSPDISQNSDDDEPALSATDSLEVRYYGLYPLVVRAQDDTEIAARKAVEGGTGIYEWVDQDEAVDGRGFAVEKAQKLLAQYGRVPREFSFEVKQSGLSAGQIMTVTISDLGLSAVEFLITSVSLSLEGGENAAWFRVDAIDSERPQGWADWFRRQAQAGRKWGIRENETVLLARPFDETVTITEGVMFLTGVSPDTYTVDSFSMPLLVRRAVSGRGTVYGCGFGRSKLVRAYGL